MSQSPWEVAPKEAKLYFGASEIVRTEKPSSNGGSYWEMQIFITPIEPDKQIIENKYFNFQPEWEKIIIPSVMLLVKAGKITQPADMESKQFVAYRWKEHRSYDARDLQYWQDRDPNKLDVDEQGRSYKRRMAIEFVDVYPNEDEWRSAHQASQQEGFTPPPQIDPMIEAARTALPTIIQVCGTDMVKLQERLQHEPLSKLGDIQSSDIKNEVMNFVVAKCGNDNAARVEMLKEINSHFNGDTPYLKLEELPEIPFS